MISNSVTVTDDENFIFQDRISVIDGNVNSDAVIDDSNSNLK